MASTSVTPNRLEMPDEVMLKILDKLGAVEILENAQLVCTHWRTISKDPVLWKFIDMSKSYDCDNFGKDEIYVNLTKQAVYRSSGELLGIVLNSFCTDDLLDFISQSSCKLGCLSLLNSYGITGRGLNDAVRRLPYLEHFFVDKTRLDVQDIEVIGLSCPRLKSFRLKKGFCRDQINCNADAFAVAKSMPELRFLQLHGNKMTDEGLQAILDGCPLLESLDVRECFNLNIDGDLVKRCMKQIKEFKCSNEADFKLNRRMQELTDPSTFMNMDFSIDPCLQELLDDDSDVCYEDFFEW